MTVGSRNMMNMFAMCMAPCACAAAPIIIKCFLAKGIPAPPDQVHFAGSRGFPLFY